MWDVGIIMCINQRAIWLSCPLTDLFRLSLPIHHKKKKKPLTFIFSKPVLAFQNDSARHHPAMTWASFGWVRREENGGGRCNRSQESESLRCPQALAWNISSVAQDMAAAIAAAGPLWQALFTFVLRQRPAPEAEACRLEVGTARTGPRAEASSATSWGVPGAAR